MSFSNPTLTNPAQHFFEWKGGEGKLEFYDKEKKERITMPLPIEFIVLDELAKITGYSKPDKSGYYSNEVRNSAKEKFTVKIKGNIVFTGFYKNSQGIAQVPKGASYAKSIYIAHKTKAGEYIIGNITAAGSARSAWFDFIKKHVVGNGKVIMTKGAQQESGTGPFYPPEFTYEHLTPEDYEAAMRLDKELQIYLNQYFAKATTSDTEHTNMDEETTTDSLATPEQVKEFENKKREAFGDTDPMERVHEANPMKPDVIIEDIEGEPINLDEIPF